MEVRTAEIPDVKIIETRRYFDQRGFFSETYNKRALMQAGIELDFVQDSHSLSVEKGVVRGSAPVQSSRFNVQGSKFSLLIFSIF